MRRSLHRVLCGPSTPLAHKAAPTTPTPTNHIRSMITATSWSHKPQHTSGHCCCVASHLACLDAQLGAAPVTALGVVPDGVASAHANPLRDGAVLASLLGQCPLGAEALVAWHSCWEET